MGMERNENPALIIHFGRRQIKIYLFSVLSLSLLLELSSAIKVFEKYTKWRLKLIIHAPDFQKHFHIVCNGYGEGE